MKNFSEHEFEKRKKMFAEELLKIQEKHNEWCKENLSYYKVGKTPTLAEMAWVGYANNKVDVHIGIKDIPLKILQDCYEAQWRVFHDDPT